MTAATMLQQALARERAGDRAGAEAIYAAVLKIEPRNHDALHLLGVLAYRAGDLARAAALLEQALQVNKHSPEFRHSLAVVQMARGNLDDARRQCELALALRPDYAEARNTLGLLLAKRGDLDSAIAAYRAVLERDPQQADAHTNLGNALSWQEKPLEAIAAHQRALALQPEFATGWNNLGLALVQSGQVDEGIAAFRRGVQIDAGLASAHWNLAWALLLKGELGPGWQEYEWRWKGCPGLAHEAPPPLFPRWNGEDLAGKTLMVHCEQGLGDEIMFASVLPEVLQRAEACLIECSPRLRKLFQRSFPRAEVLGNDRNEPGRVDRLRSWMASLPPADYAVAIGSLPSCLRRSASDFPRHRGYLKPDPQRVAHWRSRLDQLGAGPKVGISWRGGVAVTGQARRSVRLSELLPVLGQRGIHFVSLQYGPAGEEIAQNSAQPGVAVHHWPEAIGDYDDTAALVEALDLVLSVCTSVVHLSGALGKRAWVMAPYVPEWRYGMQGETMLWYPSVRLFRQRSAGDWGSVLGPVRDGLSRLAA